MVVNVWMLIGQDWCVCVCLHDSDGFGCAASMCQCKARMYGLIHTHCMFSTYLLYARDSRAAKNTFMPQRVRSQPAETNLRSELLSPHSLRRGESCHFVLIRPNLSLSSVSVAFFLSLRHHSHLVLSRSLHFPSCSLCVYLSPPSHASFF